MTITLPLLTAIFAALAVLLWPDAVTGRADAAPEGGRRAARSAHGASGPGWVRLRRRLSSVLRPAWRGGRASAVQEVQLLDGLASALEAGLPTEHAVHVVLDPGASGDGDGGDAGSWSELVRAAREGQPMGPAWQRLARRTGSLTAASVARAWTVAAVTGAPVAAAVRSSAHAARERRRLERAVEVATAGARATAMVLGALPLAGVGLAAILGVGPLTLYSHPLAMASAGVGVLLLVVGHLTVRRMVGSVLRGQS